MPESHGADWHQPQGEEAAHSAPPELEYTIAALVAAAAEQAKAADQQAKEGCGASPKIEKELKRASHGIISPFVAHKSKPEIPLNTYPTQV